MLLACFFVHTKRRIVFVPLLAYTLSCQMMLTILVPPKPFLTPSFLNLNPFPPKIVLTSSLLARGFDRLDCSLELSFTPEICEAFTRSRLAHQWLVSSFEGRSPQIFTPVHVFLQFFTLGVVASSYLLHYQVRVPMNQYLNRLHRVGNQQTCQHSSYFDIFINDYSKC